MRAFAYHNYGEADQLKAVDQPLGEPGAGKIRVKVEAVSVNASDQEMLRGKPAYTRIWGPFRPRRHVLGSDIAGRVDKLGPDVDSFQPGQSVFGDVMESWGGFADYAVVPAAEMRAMPEGLSFADAGALPQAACVAHQGLFAAADLQAGERVLINGAGGGAGAFAIQLAHRAGAHVTAVDHGDKAQFMAELGAAETVDYRQTDISQASDKFDVILDLIAVRSLLAYRRILAPGGRYILVGGAVPYMLQTLILGSLMSLVGKRRYKILAAKTNHGLETLAEMVLKGELQVPIARQYSLDDVPQAMAHFATGSVCGKLVLFASPSSQT